MNRSEVACEILNRYAHLGYTDWRVCPNNLSHIYIVAGNDMQYVLTMYQAFEIATDLECESGIRFGGDV